MHSTALRSIIPFCCRSSKKHKRRTHTATAHLPARSHSPLRAPSHPKIQIFVQTKILAEKFSHEFEICSYSYGSACLVLCSSSFFYFFFFLLSFNFNSAGHDIANIEFRVLCWPRPALASIQIRQTANTVVCVSTKQRHI